MDPDELPDVGSDYRTPFVLGKPIKNPADFYGREEVLRDLFEAVQNGQLVSVVGEHRCGNTSIIYQMLHPDVRKRYLTPDQDRGLLFALISAQLAAEGPDALFRRIGRSLRRADPDARVDFAGETDRRWMEDYLEDLADRRRRLVLLMDEFEVLAQFRHSFWEWFEGLVNEFDVSIVATSRMDLGEFRARRGGPPFFNIFRSIYVGSFRPATVEVFLRAKTEITEFDYLAVRDVIERLAGRFPYYLQVASALFYFQSGGESQLSPAAIEVVQREFGARTRTLFDDAWAKLPDAEREALTWLVLGDLPAGADVQTYHLSLQSLERRGYYLDSRIFSTALADFVRDNLRRVALNADSGRARVERRLVDLLPAQVALLSHLLRHEGAPVSPADIAQAVWPAHAPGEISADQVDEAVQTLRAAIEPADGSVTHVERLGDGTYLFGNPHYPPPAAG